LLAISLITALTCAHARACELVLRTQRAAHTILRVPLATPSPTFSLAFEHSVLGTTVRDRYEIRATVTGQTMWLVEERFSGEGYGLPHAADGASEVLLRTDEGWLLKTNRLMDPLVVRPLRAQAMRLSVGTQTWLLADLAHTDSNAAIEFTPERCSKVSPP
jgi:hypothetical protein